MKSVGFSIIIFWLILMISLLSAGCAAVDSSDTATFKNISIQEAVELIKENKNDSYFTILDVRTQEEFREGHIEGALNLDFYSASFKDDLDKLDKENTYFVYCRSGNRSGQAMKIMESLGFRKVYNLSVGITDWIAAGLPVVK